MPTHLVAQQGGTLDVQVFHPILRVGFPAGLTMVKADLFREVFRTFVRVQSAKRLAALGATAPEMDDVPRRREEPAK